MESFARLPLEHCDQRRLVDRRVIAIQQGRTLSPFSPTGKRAAALLEQSCNAKQCVVELEIVRRSGRETEKQIRYGRERSCLSRLVGSVDDVKIGTARPESEFAVFEASVSFKREAKEAHGQVSRFRRDRSASDAVLRIAGQLF